MCRPINPAKSKIGKISYNVTEKINSLLLEKLEYQQWKNTNTVVKFFKNINNKDNSKFIQMDIKDFYPSEKKKSRTLPLYLQRRISTSVLMIESLCYSTIPKHGKRTQNLALMLL